MTDDPRRLSDHTLEEFVLGHLAPADAARVQARLAAEPELARRCGELREEVNAIRNMLSADEHLDEDADGSPPALDDETLALFLDGALAAEEAEAVTQRLAQSASDQQRLVALYRETLAAQQGVDCSPGGSPVPGGPAAEDSASGPPRPVARLPVRRRRRLPLWPLGLMSAVGLALTALGAAYAAAGPAAWTASLTLGAAGWAYALLRNARRVRWNVAQGDTLGAETLVGISSGSLVTGFFGGLAAGAMVAGPGPVWNVLASSGCAGLWCGVWFVAMGLRGGGSEAKASVGVRDGRAEKSPKTSRRI